MLTVGSLFAGIGGLDLGLERAGMQVRWQVENNPYCIRVLEKHWPEVKRYGNIFEVDGTTLEPVDIICGGFPCQPVSHAGKRKGKSDDRWLWPEFARIVRSVRPKWVLVENVPGLLTIGVDTRKRLKRIPDEESPMGEILRDLALCGYDAEWDCISAASVGALHRRDRIFIVAYSNSSRLARPPIPVFPRRSFEENADLSGAGQGDVSDPPSSGKWEKSNRLQREGARHIKGRETRLRGGSKPSSTDVPNPKSPERKGPMSSWSGGARLADFRARNVSNSKSRSGRFYNGRNTHIGYSAEPCQQTGGIWATEPDVGRVADGVPSRVDRLKAIGNAVVPQVGEVIGRMIMERENAR